MESNASAHGEDRQTQNKQQHEIKKTTDLYKKIIFIKISELQLVFGEGGKITATWTSWKLKPCCWDFEGNKPVVWGVLLDAVLKVRSLQNPRHKAPKSMQKLQMKHWGAFGNLKTNETFNLRFSWFCGSGKFWERKEKECIVY